MTEAHQKIKNILKLAVAVIVDDDNDWKMTPDKFMNDIGGTAIIKIMDRAGQDLDKNQIPKYLDSGANGAAYLLSNGKVLKFTKDEKEARTAALVMKYPNEKYVFQCYDVFKFRRISGDTMYCIVQEYLKKPDKDWKIFIRHFYDWLLPDPEPGKKLVRRGEVLPGTVEKFVSEQSSDFIAKNKNKIDWLMGAGEYFQSVGISFYDLHSKNIMKRENGQHVIIDLGLSALAQKAPAIETIAKSVDK